MKTPNAAQKGRQVIDMTNFVAKRISDLPASGIRKFFDIASQMEDMVSLGVGEPDFLTPMHIRKEAIYTLEHRNTRYTANNGLLELREEVSRYTEGVCGHSYDPETQVLITVGASEGIDIILRAVLNPGDEVLVPEPSFVSYKPCVTMAGGVPIAVPTKAENAFRVKAEELAAHITPRTRILILNYPNNPTGAILEREDLEPIAALLREHENILVITDEIYAELTYTNTPHASILSLPGMAERSVLLNGFSKAYSMTGWRLGYACGPRAIIEAMTKIHQYIVMCAPTIAQYAAIEALRHGATSVAEMRDEFNNRRRYLLDAFAGMGMDCFEAQGAFYLFPSIKQFGLSSEEFCNRILQKERLAVVPGVAFGDSGEGHIRCSYAYSIDNIKEAVRRLERFIQGL